MQSASEGTFQRIWHYLLTNWEPILAYLTAVAGLIGYFVARRTERAWKRTEFLFAQGQHLDTDPALDEVVAVLDGRHASLTVDLVYDEESQLEPRTRSEAKHKFDKLLNLLQRLAYSARTARTLSQKEISLFGWYVLKVMSHERLVKYCNENGFDDLVALAKLLEIEVAKPPDEPIPGNSQPA
jgi:hypothetical protein